MLADFQGSSERGNYRTALADSLGYYRMHTTSKSWYTLAGSSAARNGLPQRTDPAVSCELVKWRHRESEDDPAVQDRRYICTSETARAARIFVLHLRGATGDPSGLPDCIVIA